MDYLELSIKIPENTEIGSDICVAELNEAGFESYQVNDWGLNAYIPEHLFDPAVVDQLSISNMPGFGKIEFTKKIIREVNWNKEWESNYDPVEVDSFCYVRSPFHNSSDKHKYEIIIEPKMSFGTGHHSTTWLVIKMMSGLDLDGKNVLDVGCGTGVLGILAAKMGCRSVTGVDIDEWAYNNSLENIKTNEIDNFKLVHGTVNDLENKFGIILANITRNILLQDLEKYAGLCSDKASLILSGFYNEDIEVLKTEAARHGFKFLDSNLKNNWAVILFTR